MGKTRKNCGFSRNTIFNARSQKSWKSSPLVGNETVHGDRSKVVRRGPSGTAKESKST